MKVNFKSKTQTKFVCVKTNKYPTLIRYSWCIEESTPPHFQLTAMKYKCLLTPPSLFLKQIPVFIVTAIKSFLKTYSQVKIHKIKIYIILLNVHDLFKNVLEYMSFT